MFKFKSNDGYTLAALIIGIAVMSTMLAIAIPIWSRVAQREKEEELIFRGKQYAFAIGRFNRKFQRLPLTLEELSEAKCIRRLYPDPMTKDGQWDLIYFTPKGPGKGETQGQIMQSSRIPSQAIIGVVSRSTKKALRPYKEKWYYNEWEFDFDAEIKVQPPKNTPPKSTTSNNPKSD